MKSVDINTLHNTLLKTCNIEKPIVTGEINGKSSKDDVKNSQAHEEESNNVLVSFVKCPLRLDHAPKPEVGGALSGLLGVLVDTSHTLVSNIEN